MSEMTKEVDSEIGRLHVKLKDMPKPSSTTDKIEQAIIRKERKKVADKIKELEAIRKGPYVVKESDKEIMGITEEKIFSTPAEIMTTTNEPVVQTNEPIINTNNDTITGGGFNLFDELRKTETKKKDVEPTKKVVNKNYETASKLFAMSLLKISTLLEPLPNMKGISEEYAKDYEQIKECTTEVIEQMEKDNVNITRYINPYTKLAFITALPILSRVGVSKLQEISKKKPTEAK